MSQYKGNQTNGAFNPKYTPAGETNDPISVVSTSIEIDGKTITGYQATYANGTSKWTAHVHTDSLFDNPRNDNSTFTGKRESDGSWTWKPTHGKNSINKLANNWQGNGLKRETITAAQISDAFYNKNGNTIQKQFNTTQNDQLKAEYGEDFKTVLNGRFENRAEGVPQTNREGTVDPDVSSVNLTSTIRSTKVRRTYGNYYYPYDIKSNKQDRVIFRMMESTGKIIDPAIKADIQPFQRRSTVIQGSVTLPITAGIKDSNIVDWGRSKMNPLQAFGAAAVMNMGEGAFKDGIQGATTAGANALNQGREILAQNAGSRQAVNAWIAEQAVGTRNLLSRATGAIANPNMELLFNAPGLRAFDFTFQMSPRDAQEAAQIRSIINFFKQGMSVKTTSTNVFLKAPNYFEVEYITFDDNGTIKQHPSLNVIKTCALLTCAVDYTPNNSYMTYSDAERSMVSYTMNLQLSELDPIYESDYYDDLGMRDSESPSTKIGY